MTTYIGQSLKRFEDPRLVMGQRIFVDDMQLPDMLHAMVVRSPHAHARILAIDLAPVQSLPGVSAVLTARELAGKVRHIPRRVVAELDGVVVPEHPVLAHDRVCYVDQPVAVVVAADRALAEDAAARLRITYQPLTPVLEVRAAAESQATLLHAEMGSNIALRLQLGRGNVAAAFARADRLVQGSYEVPRLSAAPMECRGLLARYDPQTQNLTLWTSTQVPHKVKRFLAQTLLQPPHHLRVIAPDVGGGFGQKKGYDAA